MTQPARTLVLVVSFILCSCAARERASVPPHGQWGADQASVDRRIESLLEGGGFEAALKLADSLIAHGGGDPRVYGLKARALGGLGRSAEAVALFEEALLGDYESCENHLSFATYLMKLGKTGRALTEFGEARRFCEGANIPVIYRNMAVSSMKLGNLEQARQYVEEGLDNAPDDSYLLGLKGMLIAHERPVEAETLFVRAARSGAASPDFLIQYGLLLVNAGRAAEAAAVFGKVVEERPGDREARSLLAEALDRAGTYGEAEKILRSLLAEGDDPGARAKLARVLFHRGAYAEALELYEGLEPSPEVSDRVAMCLYNLGRTDEAVAREREALAGKPDWPQAMINLAVMLGSRGELDEAQRLLERVLKLEPDNATARIDLDRLRKARSGQ
jgi:Flp pilus assembly protein TadD